MGFLVLIEFIMLGPRQEKTNVNILITDSWLVTSWTLLSLILDELCLPLAAWGHTNVSCPTLSCPLPVCSSCVPFFWCKNVVASFNFALVNIKPSKRSYTVFTQPGTCVSNIRCLRKDSLHFCHVKEKTVEHRIPSRLVSSSRTLPCHGRFCPISLFCISSWIDIE